MSLAATDGATTSATLAIVAWVIGALCASVPVSYRVTSHAATAVHEAGHFIAAMLAGRSVRAIRLNTDSSGETVSIGRARGVGVIGTLAAGYPAPCAVGLAGVVACRTGHVALWAFGFFCVLGATLLLLRNLFGLLVTMVCLGVLESIRRAADPSQARAAALAVSVFLLIAGVRGSLDLVRARGRRHDAAGLAAVTAIPAGVWKVVFLLFSLACLALAAKWSIDDVRGGAGMATVRVQ